MFSFPPRFATCFNHKVFYSSSHGNASRVPSASWGPNNFLSGALFFQKEVRGGGEKKKIFQTIFLRNNKFFPIYVYEKRGSKFHNFTNSCFWGPPVANFLTLYKWGSGQFSQCTSKKILLIFAGGGAGGVAPASGHPNTLRVPHSS
jgi:hypothetical protein